MHKYPKTICNFGERKKLVIKKKIAKKHFYRQTQAKLSPAKNGALQLVDKTHIVKVYTWVFHEIVHKS